jgi:hypothetical protein
MAHHLLLLAPAAQAADLALPVAWLQQAMDTIQVRAAAAAATLVCWR